ncbi:hypothetical protein [Gordonia sp. NPDC003950]
MSLRADLRRLAHRLPFGIGTVVAILAAAMVASVGAVLAMGTPDDADTVHDYGQLRSYPHAPAAAWTITDRRLPGYTAAVGRIEVAATHGDEWLLSYPSGIGRSYLLVDRGDGHALWPSPVRAGTGSCDITDDGVVGCAVNASSDLAKGFYLVEDDGTPTAAPGDDDSAKVVAVGHNFAHIDATGYQVTLRTPSGRTLWSRSFSDSATPEVTANGLLMITTSGGARFIVDRGTGADLLTCSGCTINVYPTGITVDRTDADTRTFDSYAVDDGRIDPTPTAHKDGWHVIPGPTTLPVLALTGLAQMQATDGLYVIVDPARSGALWQVTDPELSKANTRPCGRYVAFALKDRSRSIHALSDGSAVGSLPAPSFEDPNGNLDNLRCVGSSGSLLVFANGARISAVDPATESTAWSVDVNGAVDSVDGFIVAHEGSTLRVFQPS